MNVDLAEENLQTIRLLMERSALYRRALAPIMLLAGSLGVAAAGIGLAFNIAAPRPFAELWLGTACIAVTAAFLFARRQAFKDHEPFWSPPTYRVGEALLPPLLAGLLLGGAPGFLDLDLAMLDILMAVVWMLFYGCALHSAGFFMTRGIKCLGWIFIIGAIVSAGAMKFNGFWINPTAGNWVMGIFFGGLQFVYGGYLYFTEGKNSAA